MFSKYFTTVSHCPAKLFFLKRKFLSHQFCIFQLLAGFSSVFNQPFYALDLHCGMDWIGWVGIGMKISVCIDSMSTSGANNSKYILLLERVRILRSSCMQQLNNEVILPKCRKNDKDTTARNCQRSLSMVVQILTVFACVYAFFFIKI